MKTRRRIRRRAARKAPKIRRSAGGGGLAGAKERMGEPGGLMIGGARDPAEAKADARAATALGTTATAHRAPAAGFTAPGAAPARATKTAETAVNALGPGRPLSSPERAFYEPRLGADLAPVRLHEDATANQAARAMDAQAFTLGTDIAFSRGERVRGGAGLMAHELAHAAEGTPEVRRVIKSDASQPFVADHLLDYYGANDVVYTNIDVSSPFRRDDGPLATQIVQNMLASERIFEVAGSSLSDVQTSLDDHVTARFDVQQMARSMRITYEPTKEILDPYYWPAFKADAEKRLKAYETFRKFLGKSEDEIKKEILKLRPQVYFDMFNENVDHHKYDGLFEDLTAHNTKYADTEDHKNPDNYKYQMGCFLGALLVVYGGAPGKLRGEEIANIGAVQEDETNESWTDWIPGDFGYIEAIYLDNRVPGIGFEGINIVSYGDELFWVNLSEKNEAGSLKLAHETVEGWEGVDGAEVKPLRVYPETGLK